MGKNYKDEKDMIIRITELNSPEKTTRMNKDDHESPKNLHNESPDRTRKKKIGRAHV